MFVFFCFFFYKSLTTSCTVSLTLCNVPAQPFFKRLSQRTQILLSWREMDYFHQRSLVILWAQAQTVHQERNRILVGCYTAGKKMSFLLYGTVIKFSMKENLHKGRWLQTPDTDQPSIKKTRCVWTRCSFLFVETRSRTQCRLTFGLIFIDFLLSVAWNLILGGRINVSLIIIHHTAAISNMAQT